MEEKGGNMSTSKLKTVALITMIIDHIGLFIFENIVIFRWVGRISAPIFLFCSVIGYDKTSSKKRYMLRLYLASIIMSCIQILFSIDMNFFRTIFMCTLVYSIIDKSNETGTKKGYFLFLLYQSVILGLLIIITSTTNIHEDVIINVLTSLTASVVNLEGGLLYLFIGIILYCYRNDKLKQVIGILSITGFYTFLTGSDFLIRVINKISFLGFDFVSEFILFFFDNIIGLHPLSTSSSFFTFNYQWMLIGSLPLILLYSGKKGKTNKWMFYVIYPAHLILLTSLS